MKVFFLSLLICFVYTYDTNKAISYARRYCRNYNPLYPNYCQFSDNAHFVSQCLVAGGQDLKGCSGVNNRGLIEYVPNLENCLINKGWKKSVGMTKDFKAGYPFFIHNQHAMIATSVSGNFLYYCAHTTDRCDSGMQARSNFIYYYL